MSKRINIILPDATVEVLNKVAVNGERSRLISEAVLYYVKDRGHQVLRERLKEAYQAGAERDLKIAQEWFPVEEEEWQKTQKAKRNKKK